jgi:hypothetical protein
MWASTPTRRPDGIAVTVAVHTPHHSRCRSPAAAVTRAHRRDSERPGRGPEAGLWAGRLAALSPIHVCSSQEARACAPLTLTLLLPAVAPWRALARDARGTWASCGEPTEALSPPGRSPAEAEARALVGRLGPAGTLWVTFEGGAFLVGARRFILPEPEASLVAELGRLGFHPEPVSGATGVFRVRPAAAGA